MSSSVNQPRGTWVNIPVETVEGEIRRASGGTWRTYTENNIRGTPDLILRQDDPHTGQMKRRIVVPCNFSENPNIDTLTVQSNYVYDAFREAGIRPSADFARRYPGQTWVQPRSPGDPQDPVGRDRPPDKPLPPGPPDPGGHRGPGEG